MEENNQEAHQAWERNRDYVIANQETLRKEYGNKFIAVMNQEVIDSGENEFELAKKLYERFEKKHILISNIEEIVNPKVCHLESPEEEIK